MKQTVTAVFYCLLLMWHSVAYAFPADLEIAFVKATLNENSAGCLMVWNDLDPNTKFTYCRYELEKNNDFYRDNDQGINLSNIRGNISSDNFLFQLNIRQWFSRKYPHLTLDAIDSTTLANILSGLNFNTKTIMFADKERDIYQVEELSKIKNDDNQYQAHPKKQFAWLVHTAINQKIQLEDSREKTRTETKRLKDLKNFEIAFAYATSLKNTAGCLIIWTVKTPQKKQVYCRYELEKQKTFSRDPEKGIDLSNIIISRSRNHTEFQRTIIKWLTNTALGLTFNLSDQSELVKIMSSVPYTKTVDFAQKKRVIFQLDELSETDMPRKYMHTHDNRFAWIVHTEIDKYFKKAPPQVEEVLEYSVFDNLPDFNLTYAILLIGCAIIILFFFVFLRKTEAKTKYNLEEILKVYNKEQKHNHLEILSAIKKQSGVAELERKLTATTQTLDEVNQTLNETLNSRYELQTKVDAIKKQLIKTQAELKKMKK
ncbi:MAG: hypothetical protein KAH77_01645 [Thiomargarita sp.]|nr:hypothetical protein [Thiomargarita sp.]